MELRTSTATGYSHPDTEMKLALFFKTAKLAGITVEDMRTYLATAEPVVKTATLRQCHCGSVDPRATAAFQKATRTVARTVLLVP